MPAATDRCRFCRRLVALRITTDGHGRTIEDRESCIHERRHAARQCIDCGEAVEGKPLRCEPCKRIEARGACRRYRERNPERYEATQRKSNRKRRTEAARAKRREYERQHRSTAEYRERRKKLRRVIAIRNPERRRRQHEAYKARHPDRVREQQRRANERRAAAKREYMHRYATKYVGPGRSPTCRDCGAEIEFNGRGRPHVRCPECDPKSWRRDQSKRTRSAA